MSDPHEPNMGVRMPFPKGLGGGDCVLAQGIAPAVHIDSDYLAPMVRLNQMTDLPLIDVLPKLGRVIGKAASRHD